MRRRVRGPPSALVAIAAGLLALVPAGAVLGPLAVARALSDAGGDVDGALLGAAGGCAALAVAAFALADRWTSAWS